MSATRDPNDDAYVRAFMGGDTVAFLEKVRAPWWLNATLLSAGVVGAVACVSSGAYVVAGVIALLTTFMAGFLMELRTAVTATHVHIQYGTAGPRIAMSEITAVDVVDYDAFRYGGWGIRRSFGGVSAYSVPGRGGKAVRITKRDGRVVVVTSEQPAALRAAIEQARGGATSALDAARTNIGVLDAPTASAEVVEAAVAEASATTTKQR
jgi:hypothetical protein